LCVLAIWGLGALAPDVAAGRVRRTGMTAEVIEGDGVRLRAYRAEDVEDVVHGCDDPVTRKFLATLPSPYTGADALWWITEGAPAAFAGGGAAYAIADPRTDRLLGGVGLDRVLPVRQQAEIGYWVAPGDRRRGVATAAVRALSGWAFTRTGTARLELLTSWTNVASQRVALAAGFQREGVRRGAAVDRAGDREDLIAYTRMADDPPGPTARLLPDLPGGELTDGVVTLRPLTAADAAFHGALCPLPEIVATSVPPQRPEPAQVARRCARAPARWLAGERADLVIVATASGEPAGEIGLYHQEPANGQAVIGYGMLPAWRGRGFATRAVQLLALWAFAETPVARLVAGAMPENIASQRVLRRAGFRREGYTRARLPGASGRRVDDVQYALVAEDLLAPGDARLDG
jgi:RimJ/RimL family protein N-acetyltransferase